MAASSLFTLIDDIATLLDDIAVMSKVAAKKTAGVLGDDLALNAQQVTGVKPERELPVVWAVARGSFVNKLILVPLALLISHFVPQAVLPLLMIGGAFLCYEGCEKLAHKFLHHEPAATQEHQQHLQALADPSVDLLALEKDKIKGAVRTDFILSAEIIVIALGTITENMPQATLLLKSSVLAAISIAMTVGVYGLVAAIVKMDDAGLYLSQRKGSRALGQFLLGAAPRLMKLLSIAGTVAMFLVGGGIITHSIASLHHWVEHSAHLADPMPVISTLMHWFAPSVLNMLAGLLTGSVVLLLVTGISRLMRRPAATPAS